MYILNYAKMQIINTDFVERICVQEKNDAALIILSYGDQRAPIVVGRYKDTGEAKEVLEDLFTSIAGGQAYYFMPDSRLFGEETVKKDARIKRKGGS